jgi:hypothetical protein
MQSVKNAVLRKLSANLVNEAMAEKSRGIAKNFSQGRIKVKASSCHRKMPRRSAVRSLSAGSAQMR